MGEDPEQLERQIEATRAKLGEDIDALEEKINPKKVAHRTVEGAKEKAAEVKDRVLGATGAAKDRAAAGGTAAPSGAGPTDGAGLGGKVAGLVGTARERTAPLVGTAREKTAPLVEKAAPMAESIKEKAAVRSGLDPQTADTRQVATALASETWATVQDQTRRNPALAGAVAFGLGFLLGR